MIADLEQLADEAIRLRWDYVRAADRVPQPIREAIRAERLVTWAWCHPALDALAVQRETDLGHLYAEGITPDGECTESVGNTTVTARAFPAPLAHHYTLHYGAADTPTIAEGQAWLCSSDDTAGRRRYTAVLGRWRAYGDTLAAAVNRVAVLADDEAHRLQDAVKRGDVL